MSDQPAQNDSTDDTTEVAVQLDSDRADPDDKHAASQEAGRWRLKYREADAEREALAQKVENLQRAQVDAHVTALGLKPQALWASGAQLTDLLTDDGTPDADAIAAAVKAARDALGIQPKPAPGGLSGLRSGNMARPEPANTWVSAFAPKK